MHRVVCWIRGVRKGYHCEKKDNHREHWGTQGTAFRPLRTLEYAEVLVDYSTGTVKRTMSKLGVPNLLGIPFDGQSSYLRGAGDAPPKIREALRCDASNSWTELGVDLSAAGVYEDAGDLLFAEKDAFAAIEAGVRVLIDQRKRPLSLGGDHSITFPLVKAFAQ